MPFRTTSWYVQGRLQETVDICLYLSTTFVRNDHPRSRGPEAKRSFKFYPTPNLPKVSIWSLIHAKPGQLPKWYQNATEAHVKGWKCNHEIIQISCTQIQLSVQITTSCVDHVLLVCAGLISQYAISGFWHLRVPWWSYLPFLGSVNEPCRSMINYYTFFVSWSRLGCFISLSISKSMLFTPGRTLCWHVSCLLPGVRGEYGSGDISTLSSRSSFVSSVVVSWVRLYNRYSQYVILTNAER